MNYLNVIHQYQERNQKQEMHQYQETKHNKRYLFFFFYFYFLFTNNIYFIYKQKGVVVIAGALLEKAEELLEKDIHPVALPDAWKIACIESVKIFENMSKSISLSSRELLINSAITSLS